MPLIHATGEREVEREKQRARESAEQRERDAERQHYKARIRELEEQAEAAKMQAEQAEAAKMPAAAATGTDRQQRQFSAREKLLRESAAEAEAAVRRPRWPNLVATNNRLVVA